MTIFNAYIGGIHNFFSILDDSIIRNVTIRQIANFPISMDDGNFALLEVMAKRINDKPYLLDNSTRSIPLKLAIRSRGHPLKRGGDSFIMGDTI